MAARLPAFKAYDIRGRIPDQLNEEIAEQVGRAFATIVAPQRVVVGHDIRLSSRSLSDALIEGLTTHGVDVIDIGLCGTEEVYFATAHLKVDGGVMVTASHNPRDYNGMKLVRSQARPISGDTGLMDIEAAVREQSFAAKATKRGTVDQQDTRPAYIDHLLQYIDRDCFRPLTVVSNPGNGCAGPLIEALAPHLPLNFVKVHHEPNGEFPNGIPNPLLPENRPATAEATKRARAAAGIAWDGDFDRCFLFDENGDFIEGYYIVGLLATEILKSNPGGKVIYDPRLTWNTIELVEQAGGKPVMCKSGHAFIKERMRQEDAVYGGEMSAHHYFRDFSYCDSGMLPWLYIAQALCQGDEPLSAMVGQRVAAYPISGEINRHVPDADQVIAEVRKRYEPGVKQITTVDGVSLEFANWRMNLRKSNTEPLIRLNVETRGDRSLLEEKTAEILALMADHGATE
ncbi:MAG: phosphomannomutase [Deltaproteobacteria bacterium]|nr:phosphomannomutase [Deltaproteobacteria bacterium]